MNTVTTTSYKLPFFSFTIIVPLSLFIFHSSIGAFIIILVSLVHNFHNPHVCQYHFISNDLKLLTNRVRKGRQQAPIAAGGEK